MVYDLEKYRDKREKVLGVKKRGVSFGTLAAVVSSIIILGLSSFVIPKSVAYLNTRNLDDAILKLQKTKEWPHSVITALRSMEGVKSVSTDNHNTRLVVTFDRNSIKLNKITTLIGQHGLKAVVLNRVNHNQRVKTMKEEAQLEAL